MSRAEEYSLNVVDRAELASGDAGKGLSLLGTKSGLTAQQEIDRRSFLSFSPQSINISAGANSTVVRTAIQSLVDMYANTSQTISIPRVDQNYQTDLPILLNSGNYLSVYGIVENINTSGSSYQQPTFYAGCFNQAMTSPGWVPASGTNRPIPLYNGMFNAAGEFELDGTVQAGSGVTPASSTTWFASKNVGDIVLFVSAAGYQFEIGSGGSGGVGINRECIEVYRITSKTAGSPNKLIFDKPSPFSHTVGSVCDAASSLIVDDSVVGTTFRVLDDLWIEGPGGFKTAGVGMFRTGCRNLFLNVGFLQQKYGLGGNLMIDCNQYAETVIANDKAWDIAAASRRSRYGFGTMVVLGDGSDVAGKGVFGENSRWCHVTGRVLSMPNMVGDNVVAFNVASDCSVNLDLLDARKVAGTSIVRMGILNSYTTVGGGVPSCSRNKVTIRDARCGTPTYFVDITSGGTVTEDNVISDDCVFYGTPTIAAVRDRGTRSYIGGYYPNGDIDISGAVAATVNARLGNGIVVGHTESTGKSVTVNGIRLFPGAYYPAVITTSGSVTYTPNASVGMVGENKFEHRIAFSAATSVTIGVPTSPVESQELNIEIRNQTGSSFTPSLNSVFVGVTPVSIDNGNKTIFSFISRGGKWFSINSSQNVTYDGETFVNESFTTPGRWVIPSGLSITGGTLSKTVSPDGSTTHLATVSIPRIVSGRSYKITFTVGSRSAGGITPRLGNVAGTIRNASGTYSETIVAGTGGTVGFLFSGSSNNGITIDNVIVQEL